MCVAVLMKVIKIDEESALVEMGGTQKTIGLDIVDPKHNLGDYVIVHAGFAIDVLDENEAQIILNDFEEMLAHESDSSH